MKTSAREITFVSHTNKPGGGELALRRYLESTSLPVRLVTLDEGGVWEGLDAEVIGVRGVRGLRSALRGGDLVVANSMRAAFLTALVLPREARLVYWVRDGLTESAMSRLALFSTSQVTARRVSHYLANSAWTAGTVRKALQVRADQVEVVHSVCGVEAEDLDGHVRTRPRSPVRLLYLGRLAPWKAPDLAVRALGELEVLGVPATLTIAGDAQFGERRYATQLRSLVERSPAVSMVGHVDDVMSLLADHDVVVHCSTVPEPFGQVIVQGLAAGMPVIAPDDGGPQEILARAPVRGLYVPGDAAAMASRIVENVEKYAEVSSWATRRARPFTDHHLVALTDGALTRLMARPGS